MKSLPVLLLVALSLVWSVPGARAQSAPAKRVSPAKVAPQVQEQGPQPQVREQGPQPQESEQASWLFLLQTRTQWLLVIHESGDAPDATSGASLEDGSSGPSSVISTSVQVPGSQGTGSPTSNSKAGGDATDKAPATVSAQIIFEGNTKDVPWEPTSPPLPPKQSAPAS